MRPSKRLRVEQLEDRALPATFWNPWPDGSHITMSFVQDGTDIHGVASNLSSAILSGTSGEPARLAVLRPMQWLVANANINVGLVGDNGAAWDATGAVQSDSRFGDIRVGGRNWADDVLSLTTTFNYFNTESGNIAVNTGKSFSYGSVSGDYDLFTAMLQETGHSLGVGNSDDAASVMYEFYQGARAGLSAGDVASIQSLYGARKGDAFEGTTGNNTAATATTYTAPLTADLTTTSDVDYYSFNVGFGGAAPTVTLQASGLSLVQARVQVVNSFGVQIAEGSAANPINNDVTVNLPAFLAAGTYYVRVSSAVTDVFGVGSYHLTIGGASSSGGLQTITGVHDTFTAAATINQVGDRIDYSARVNLANSTGVTLLQLQAPPATSTTPVNLVVSVANVSDLEYMQVNVYDALQNEVAARVLTSVNGSTVVQVDNVAGGATYFIQVVATKSFDVMADFTTRNTRFDLGSTADTSAWTSSATLNIAQSQTIHFALAATGDSGSSVCFTIKDAAGNAIFTLSSAGGTARSKDIFLAAGYYTVELSLVAGANYDGSAFTYSLYGWTITDPIGVAIIDPPAGGGGTTTPPPPTVNNQTAYFNNASGGNFF